MDMLLQTMLCAHISNNNFIFFTMIEENKCTCTTNDLFIIIHNTLKRVRHHNYRCLFAFQKMRHNTISKKKNDQPQATTTHKICTQMVCNQLDCCFFSKCRNFRNKQTALIQCMMYNCLHNAVIIF